ncbi:hypothetical protein MLD38_040579 [Melastoma candidum]|nr:hypothetical protein MLD38_040579 [Melastoma candidum]
MENPLPLNPSPSSPYALPLRKRTSCAMNSIASRLARGLRINCCLDQHISLALDAGRAPRRLYSAAPSESESEMNDNDDNAGEEEAVVVKGESDAGADEYDEILGKKREMQLHGVDPRRGWGFRGVHKAIICGRIGQAPVQKMLRNGRTVTIFTVGTGGLFDQRIVGARDLPKPAQWHRIAVHNEALGAYAVQQLVKNSSVYVEGDIETRVYNDSINGEVKNIPEICVRFDGRIRLIKSGESVAKLNFDDLREGLF